MKKAKTILISSFFVYLLMFDGQWTGYSYNTIGQCQSAKPSPYHYCIWAN